MNIILNEEDVKNIIRAKLEKEGQKVTDIKLTILFGDRGHLSGGPVIDPVGLGKMFSDINNPMRSKIGFNCILE